MKGNLLIAALFIFIFPHNSIAQSWSPVCTTGQIDYFVTELVSHNDDIYAGGSFNMVCGDSAHHVAHLNDGTWVNVGGGLPTPVSSLASINGELYAACVANSNSNNLYRLGDSTWEVVGGTFSLANATTLRQPNLYDVIEYNGDLVVSGEFELIDGVQINGIAKFVNGSWQPLGNGLYGTLSQALPRAEPAQMCIYNGDLIAVGNFKSAGSSIVNGVARWDGTQWHSMGAGFDYVVKTACVFQGDLYIGGEFTGTGFTPLLYFAKWDGTQWIYAGRYFDNRVLKLKVVDNKLFIMGDFQQMIQNQVGATSAIRGVVYDNYGWRDMDGGADSDILAVETLGNGVIVGGGFVEVGNGFPYRRMALWQDPVSTKNIMNYQNLTIQPNPTNGFIQLNFDKNIQAIGQITNLEGKILQQFNIQNKSQKTLNLSDLPKGLYVVSIRGKDVNIVEKVVLH